VNTSSSSRERGHRVLAAVRWPLGGIRTYILYNYPALIEAGYRFTFIGPEGPDLRKLRDEAGSWQGAEFIQVPVSGEKCNFRPAVRDLLAQGRFAVIHSHGLKAAVQVVMANAGHGVPHVVTSHGMVRPEIDFPGLLGKVRRMVVGRVLGRADALVAVSNDAYQNHLEAFPRLRSSRCELIAIPNGIDVSRFVTPHQDDRCQLRRKLDLDDRAFLIGFLGRFEEEKGFTYLVNAIAQLASQPLPRDFHLLAVGRGECPRRYQAKLAALPHAARRITFVDHVSRVATILPDFDLVVVPSVSEASPLVPMEAMCAGTPVLGTDCPGLREALRGTPSVMVSARDSAALAAAIRKAMTCPWTDKAREYAPVARERFDVRKSAGALLGLFDELSVGRSSRHVCQRTSSQGTLGGEGRAGP